MWDGSVSPAPPPTVSTKTIVNVIMLLYTDYIIVEVVVVGLRHW